MLILGWFGLLTLGAMLCINAIVMLISPSAWFKLPNWIRAQGTLSEKKNSQGIGAFETRLLGAIILAVIAWVVYDYLKN